MSRTEMMLFGKQGLQMGEDLGLEKGSSLTAPRQTSGAQGSLSSWRRGPMLACRSFAVWLK